MSLGFLETSARQARATEHVEHRPWRLPSGPWTSAQSWVDLAFLHWRVDADALAPLLPDWVELETYDGMAWLGVVPFTLTGLRLRGLPPLPRLSTFPELNVRTYVSHDERPGIWFLSLDAGSLYFVEAARRLYRLPYAQARMTCVRGEDGVHFESSRSGAAFDARYRGEGELFHAEAGSLEYFLTERYCLYTEDAGRPRRADVHHPPWSLQRGWAEVELDGLVPVALPGEPPDVLFSPRQDTVVWPLEPL